MTIYTKLKKSVQKNQIRNFSITTDDISRSEAIHAPQIYTIQGKAIGIIPDHHNTIPRIPLPPLMYKHHQNMELFMNFSL